MSGIRLLTLAGVLTWSATCVGQPVTIGSLGTPTGGFGPGPFTIIDLSQANRPGSVTSATFLWSDAPCPAAVKIRFFSRFCLRFPYGCEVYAYADRGPFDVSQRTQTVALIPPVSVGAGFYVEAQIAIVSLNYCGGSSNRLADDPSGGSLVLPGDVTRPFAVSRSTNLRPLVQATDSILVLLKNRFTVTLTATDPRSGKTTIGRGVAQGDRYGYFSLPEFTGDPDFPEVIIKMADATGSPPPYGGSFWFFYSSLTDVQYTLTVTDQSNGRTRTYTKDAGGLCGGADTGAFQP